MLSLLDTLVREGTITREQLQEARDKQMGAKKPLQELLVEMGFIKEADLIKVSSRIFNMPIVKLDADNADPDVLKLFPYDAARKYGAFPVRKEKDVLVVAMSDPMDIIAIDNIRLMTNMKVRPILCEKGEINSCIEKFYNLDDNLYDILKNISEDGNVEVIAQASPGGSIFDVEKLKTDTSAVVRLVNIIISDAIKQRASDIHIEPQEKEVDLRYRIDGNLKNVMKFPKDLRAKITARIKIISGLDIAETMKTQDGRSSMMVNNEKIDLRVSSIPTFHGEKLVMRVLDPKKTNIELDMIGMRPEELDEFKAAVFSPQGIILVTGPTGSGKTTTLYAAINYVKGETKNIVTVEDPIEYLMDGVSQMQVNLAKGVTFAAGLRSILRQDPNIILIGEIRDRETADIAFRSSLTGHLVLSTLHTNDAVSTITRLFDIGIEPYLTASSLILIMAQRLVRLICPSCKEEYAPETGMVDKFRVFIDGLGIKTFYRGKGCEQCGFSGYLGRTGIYEALGINEKIRSLINAKAPEDEIYREARINGLRSLAEAGIEKVSQALTTLDEVARIAGVAGERDRKKAPEHARGGLKVLIADDDKLMRMMVKDAFKKEGDKYGFIEAADGKEAVSLAHSAKPDLLITDVMMPGLNGYEVVKKLRSSLETAALPIVMLTTMSDKASEIKGLDTGADDYIAKPFDKDRLLARVKMLLKKRV